MPRLPLCHSRAAASPKEKIPQLTSPPLSSLTRSKACVLPVLCHPLPLQKKKKPLTDEGPAVPEIGWDKGLPSPKPVVGATRTETGCVSKEDTGTWLLQCAL